MDRRDRPDLAPVHGILATLRRKVRSAWMVRGAAFILAAACALITTSFALDFALEMPVVVRAVHLALVVVALGVVTRIVLLKPLATELDEETLVQTVEHGVPELADRLASALDFERRMADPNEPESKSMMASVIEEARGLAASVDPGRLLDPRPARRAAGAAALGLVAVAALAFSSPAAFGIWVQRGILLADVPWPRKTNVRVLELAEDQPLVVTRGDDLRVVAVAEGKQPRVLELHFEELLATPDEGAEPKIVSTDIRTMYPVEGEDGHFAFDFRAVSSSFRFWVTGGDDQDRRPLYEVQALVPPRIASITATIRYPDYAGLPDATSREPSVEVLEGSHVRFDLRTNMPVASASLVPPDGEPQPITLTGAGDELTIEFDVSATREFHIELIAASGQRNRPEQDVFFVRTVEDRAPSVRVLFPIERLYRTPNGVIPLKTVVEDDFGVSRVSASLVQGERVLRDLELGASSGEGLQKRIDSYLALDLQQFQGDGSEPLESGDVLTIVVVATDNNGNERIAPDIGIDIITPEDLQSRLSDRQFQLREELMLVRRSHSRVLSGIRGIRAGASEGDASQPLFDAARDLQVDEGRVANDLRQFLSGIEGVFDAYVLNRMGSPPTIDRVLPLYDEALAAPPKSGESVFGSALYGRIVAEKRAGRLYDPEVIGTLLDILDIGDRSTTEIAPAVTESLRSWAMRESTDRDALAAAEASAVELDAQLAELERRMERWEDLNEIIARLRDLKETQIDLSQPVTQPTESEDR